MRTLVLLNCVIVVFGLALPVLSEDGAQVLWSVSSFGDNDFFDEPSDLEVDRARSLIYVVDAGSCRVIVFDFKGGFLRAFGRKGQGPGEFARPTGLCLLPDSGTAVADFGGGRIQVFDAAGKFTRSVTVMDVRVADLHYHDGRFFSVPSFGASSYAITLGSEEKGQPLVNVLDGQGQRIAEISTSDFPEKHPFIRAIKHRVCLTLSPRGRLFLPYFAVNLVQVFETTGRKDGEFNRPLPFKPMTPALIEERSPEKGIVQMRADLDFVSLAAKFGPDGSLYILTVTEAMAEIRKTNPKLEDPLPMRVDVVDPESRRVVRTVPCDPGVKAFGLMDGGRMVYVCEDAEGELALKCVKY